MIRVKICGVTRPDDAYTAAVLGAWAVGVIFVPGTPRCVSIEGARRIFDVLPRETRRVGVFMDQDGSDIRKVEKELKLDLVQLHGAETPLFCGTLGLDRCLKMVPLAGESDLERALERKEAYLLVDRPRGAAPIPRVDWAMAARLAASRPRTLLAGGLDPANVADAVVRVKPWGVDVSSGVERAPGVKDKVRLRDFFAAVKRADERLSK